MKAARKLVFEFLDTTKGYGWWGKNENKEFYQQLSAEDNPWNWVKTFRVATNAPEALATYGPGGHADKIECACLEYLFPGTIKLERLCETDDWFAQDAGEMQIEAGKAYIEESIINCVKDINAQRGNG